jgi:hypothetical protein
MRANRHEESVAPARERGAAYLVYAENRSQLDKKNQKTAKKFAVKNFKKLSGITAVSASTL